MLSASPKEKCMFFVAGRFFTEVASALSTRNVIFGIRYSFVCTRTLQIGFGFFTVVLGLRPPVEPDYSEALEDSEPLEAKRAA